jgi:dienelactone hydrolase
MNQAKSQTHRHPTSDIRHRTIEDLPMPPYSLVMLAFVCVQPPAAASSPGERLIRGYLSQEARRLDEQFLDGIATKADWEKRRPLLHRQYMEMLGLWPMPARTPLEPKVTGVIDRAEGFRIEKVHFQSRPHLYVTGNLYVPKQIKEGERLPAVLYVCGHSGRGRDGNKTAFQHHGMWLATHGYVCLTIDSLQLGEIGAIHHGTYRYNRWWWQARGYTPAGVECWNGIRAIDYLQSRPEVDPNKIAVTGISGGGAATFWIAAADERVQVAVPVSGMSDLEDYVGERVVNGHCDCMFLINAHQWPWTHIAALVAPRPLLFENSGHDTIFPMPSNDRIRARLETLYRLFTDKPAELFDIGVTPGGHSDNPELRLMAYRWINRHLKGDNAPVTEPTLAPVEGKELRAFPNELPADELNTRIDESFVPTGEATLPRSRDQFDRWRESKLAELRRLSFAGHRKPVVAALDPSSEFAEAKAVTGRWLTEEQNDPERFSTARQSAHVVCEWRYLPPKGDSPTVWLVVMNPGEPLDQVPAWFSGRAGNDAVLLLAPRGGGSLTWDDKPPFYIQRSMALLGRTVDSGRVADVQAFVEQTHYVASNRTWKIAGRGPAGVIAAYAAALAPEHCVDEVLIVDPPTSHRDGPIFLNVLRVLDIPDAFGLLAPRQLTVETAQPAAFDRTAQIYRTVQGRVSIQAAAAARADFVPLFPDDGAPRGWCVRQWNDVKQPAPAEAVWRVREGVLYGSERRGTWLVSDAQYGDFELQFEWKLGERGNSGCGLRFPPFGDPAFDGLELQMVDLRYNTAARDSELTGGLYRALAPRVQVYKPTEWNRYEIRCVGPRVQVTLNGEPILDVNLEGESATVKRHDGSVAPPLKARPRRGHIGFQELSRDGAQVQIRHARIRVLD